MTLSVHAVAAYQQLHTSHTGHGAPDWASAIALGVLVAAWFGIKMYQFIKATRDL